MPEDQSSPTLDISSIESILAGEKDIEWRQGYVVVSASRFQEILNERDQLLAKARKEVADAKAEADDNARALRAWFEQRRITQGQIDDEISDAVAGYLKTSESGGIDPALSQQIKEVVDEMLSRGLVADVVNRRMAHPDDRMTGVLHEIEAERVRQIAKEGWTASNDDRFDAGRLAAAAGTYALHAADTLAGNLTPSDEVPRTWTMHPDAWKPKDARRDLVRAAALAVAELERMQREEDAAEGVDASAPCRAAAIERDWLRRHRNRIGREAQLHPDLYFYSTEMLANIAGTLRSIPLAEPDPDEEGGRQTPMGRAALSMCIAAHYMMAPGDTLEAKLHGTTEESRDTGDFEVTIHRKR